MQVVQSNEQLFPRAIELARMIAGKSSAVTATIKEMQQVGQQYDVAGALQYELGYAIAAYSDMGKDGAKTKDRLSKGFSNRSKL